MRWGVRVGVIVVGFVGFVVFVVLDEKEGGTWRIQFVSDGEIRMIVRLWLCCDSTLSAPSHNSSQVRRVSFICEWECLSLRYYLLRN